ncbi:MAG: hypothetical protein HUU37_09960 [Bdellovibrionales bacterium]|nr:hypothetical protein [Bdellovibrionales bacterium]
MPTHKRALVLAVLAVQFGVATSARAGFFDGCKEFRMDGDGNAVLEMQGEVAYDPRSRGLVGGADGKSQKFPGSRQNKDISLRGRGPNGETVEVLVFHEIEGQQKGQFRVYSALVRATLPPQLQEMMGLTRYKGACIVGLNFVGLRVDPAGNLQGSFHLFPRGMGAGLVLAALTRPGECASGEVVCAHDAPEKYHEARWQHAVGAAEGPRAVSIRSD